MRNLFSVHFPQLISHFITPNKATLLFALKGIISVGMALSFAMYLALDNPFWAAIPAVMLQARPHSGFVIEKALFLVLSSFIGALLAFLILSYFIHNSTIAIAFLTLIVAAVTFLSSSLRHGNFIFGLALIAITANMIVLFAISHIEIISSQAIFNIAFARISEVIIGALCAVLTSTLFFPLRMKDLLSDHTTLLINHLQIYLALIFDDKKNEDEKEKQLKKLMGLMILINDDITPNFYENHKNMKKAIYIINQTMNIITLINLLNLSQLTQFNNDFKFSQSIRCQDLKKNYKNILEINKKLKLVNDKSNYLIFSKILSLYKNIILAEIADKNINKNAISFFEKRWKSHRDIFNSALASMRAVVIYLICILIWSISGGGATLIMMIILPILFVQMFANTLNSSSIIIKIFKGAMLGVPISIFFIWGISANVTGYLEMLLLVMLPFLFFGLMAMTNPLIVYYGLGFCLSIITCVQPSNHMTFAVDQALSIGLSMLLGIFITSFIFKILPSIPKKILQKRVLKSMLRQFKENKFLKKYHINRLFGEKMFFLSLYECENINSKKIFNLGFIIYSTINFLSDFEGAKYENKDKLKIYHVNELLYLIFNSLLDNNFYKYCLSMDELLVEIEGISDSVYKNRLNIVLKKINFKDYSLRSEF